MKRRFLVYTAVFGGYDRVYPPIMMEPELDYVIVTDDALMLVPGWRIHVVEGARFPTNKAANLYFRALIHRELPGYDASLYVDGNLRLIGKTSTLFPKFLESGAALGVYPHPLRRRVVDEAEACILRGKVVDPAAIRMEIAAYAADGFPDDQGLIYTGVLLKNHRAPDLDPAMSMWSLLFQKYCTRDQLSLPYVKWKVGFSCAYLGAYLQHPNPYFGLYPHRGASHVRPLYSHVVARSFDSWAYRCGHKIWQFVWTLRRKLRRRAGVPPVVAKKASPEVRR